MHSLLILLFGTLFSVLTLVVGVVHGPVKRSALEISPSLASSQPNLTYHLGSGFSLSWNLNSSQLVITGRGQEIWSTVPNSTFITASTGNDTIVSSNGNFNITNVDTDLCQQQVISSIASSPVVDGSSSVTVSGNITNCGNSTIQTNYTLVLGVPPGFQDRVAFQLDVFAPNSSQASVQPLNKVYLIYQSNATEDFYGFGAQASFASLKNQSVPIFSREQGVGRGDQPITTLADTASSFAGGDNFTTYTAIPQYVTTEGRVIYLTENTTAYATFDLTSSDAVTIRYAGLSMGGHILRAGNMLDALQLLTNYTGRMPPLPTWVDTGAVLGIQGGQDRVYEIVAEGMQENISCPIAGVWLQDWTGNHTQEAPFVNLSRLWWNWENDAVLYPNWTSLVDILRVQFNVRTMSYINPFLADTSNKTDPPQRNLFLEASNSSYLVRNSTTDSSLIISSGPGINAGILDLTNNQTRAWFTDVLRDQVWNSNISGFMSDFGEYTPVTSDVELVNASDAFVCHNQYPLSWAQLQRGVIEELNKTSEAVVFHRSAAFLANRYMNLFWAGDQNVNWDRNDGLKSVVPIFVHMGFSGYSQLHSDIGGYTTTLTAFPPGGNVTRSAELLGRWGELAAVSSAVFRSHEGSIPSVNAQFYDNTTTYAYFAHNARLFAALAPYRRRILDTECAPNGWPLLRAPVVYHTADARARNVSYESFYLGPDLYVAPVFDAGAQSVQAYLPGDGNSTFTHVWSNATFAGGARVTVQTPYGQPPIFVVNNATSDGIDALWEFVQQENGSVYSID